MQTIEGIFTNAQNEEEYPYQDEISDDDARYSAYIAATTFSGAQKNAMKRDELLQVAAIRIAPLQDAIDLNRATADDKKLLLSWKEYRVALNVLDLNPDVVAWPSDPQQI
jgi:hypothetical protein